MAAIGDWEVTLIREEVVPNQPGNPEAGSKRYLDYTFKYIPLGIIIPRSITHLQFVNEEDNQVYLVNLVDEMKRGLIDRILSST